MNHIDCKRKQFLSSRIDIHTVLRADKTIPIKLANSQSKYIFYPSFSGIAYNGVFYWLSDPLVFKNFSKFLTKNSKAYIWSQQGQFPYVEFDCLTICKNWNIVTLEWLNTPLKEWAIGHSSQRNTTCKQAPGVSCIKV